MTITVFLKFLELMNFTIIFPERVQFLREKSPFQLGNQRVEGEIIGVSSQGQLKIRIADEVQLVEHGQLTWIFQ